MAEIRDCSVCFGGDFIQNIKFCFNCGYDSDTCKMCHSRGTDCPEWIPITNANYIRSMTDEELAEWISGIAYARKTPWDSLFARKFCDTCHKIKSTLPGWKTIDLYECDYVDGNASWI